MPKIKVLFVPMTNYERFKSHLRKRISQLDKVFVTFFLKVETQKNNVQTSISFSSSTWTFWKRFKHLLFEFLYLNDNV